MKEPYLPFRSSNPMFDHRTIEASNETLLRQAPMTANEYLLSAIDHIDAKLGAGYAAKHPELIAAFMQTSAIDLGTAEIARAIEGHSNAIEELSGSLAAAIVGTREALRGDYPLQGETFESVTAALNSIADAIGEHVKA
jgi:hypothetical protein